LRIFLAGIMQGSRRERDIVSQDYRAQLTQLLRRHLDDVEIVDPFALHPGSVDYSHDEGQRAFLSMAEEAGRCDVVIAYLPEASMGSAIEIWQAYSRRRAVFIISPLDQNWVVRFLSTRLFAGIDEFAEFVASGEFRRAIETQLTPL
jgi:hypothetical protein